MIVNPAVIEIAEGCQVALGIAAALRTTVTVVEQDRRELPASLTQPATSLHDHWTEHVDLGLVLDVSLRLAWECPGLASEGFCGLEATRTALERCAAF